MFEHEMLRTTLIAVKIAKPNDSFRSVTFSKCSPIFPMTFLGVLKYLEYLLPSFVEICIA